MNSILVLEHDILVRTALAGFLRECGHHVVEGVNGGEGRQLVASPDTRIDIVLCAAALPDESGFQFAAWVRERHPHIDVLLAGSIETAARKASNLCDADPEVIGAHDHEQLRDRIRWLLAKRDRKSSARPRI